jgi:succinate-semialdehyde dehydrogenase/glutarate-semialdehyde dehydrogenase
MKVINPATGELVREYPEHTDSEVAHKLACAEQAFAVWRRSPWADRTEAMENVGRALRGGRESLARLMTEEMGKPIAQALVEIDKCAWVCEFYAANAERLLAVQPVATEAARSYVRFDPIGPVLAIMPWNFPFWQVFRFAAPALMAGNVAILKHASNVPGSSLVIEELFRQSGFPQGAFTSLLVSSAKVPGLIRHPAVQAVTLTGSEKAGAATAEEAGRQIKKTVLELGGSDPFIVLADADLTVAVRQAVRARVQNSGQSCIAAKRFIVEEPVADAFEAALVRQMRALKVGHPTDGATEVGPLARQDLRDELHALVTRSIDAGARLLLGGQLLEGPGFFYAPTVLTNVQPGIPAFDEETFGPVAAVVRAKDYHDAVSLANRSTFGLGASIWTSDAARAAEMAAELEAGAVFVNEMVKSDPRLPFGGIKRSGYGRELSEFGIREFVNVKTVWIAK